MTTPKVAKKGPYKITLEEGERYNWCACGLSNNQPFCDGSHKGSGITPVAFTAEKSEEVALCGCKQTKNPPFCDGTHNKL